MKKGKKKKGKNAPLILEESNDGVHFVRVVLTAKGKIVKEAITELGPTTMLIDGEYIELANVTLRSKETL
jgi:hypothetical protein